MSTNPRELADQLRAEGQDEMAAEIGRMVDTDENRTCVLTGKIALGYARVPGTDPDVDLPLSHGRDERPPTAFQRWLGGWKNDKGVAQKPQRPSAKFVDVGPYADLRMGRSDPLDHGPAQGGEAILAALGAKKGSLVTFDFLANGDIVIPRGRS